MKASLSVGEKDGENYSLISITLALYFSYSVSVGENCTIRYLERLYLNPQCSSGCTLFLCIYGSIIGMIDDCLRHPYTESLPTLSYALAHTVIQEGENAISMHYSFL